MGNFFAKLKNTQTMELKSISKSLKDLAHEREEEEKPEKLKIKQAIIEGNMKSARVHAKNAIRMRTEVTSYRQISSRIDCMVEYIDDEPTLNNSVPEIVEAIDSSLATGNLKKMLDAMDRIETQFFNNEEGATKLKTNSVVDACAAPVVQKEDEINNLIQEVAGEYKLKISWEENDHHVAAIN